MRRVVFFLLMLVGLCFTMQAQMPISARAKTNNNNNSNRNNNPNFVPQQLDKPDSTQNKEPEGIVFDYDEEPDSVLIGSVFSFPHLQRAVKLYRLGHPSLDPTGVEFFNPVHSMDGLYYIDLGALGQSHLSLCPYNIVTQRLFDVPAFGLPLTLNWQNDVHPVFRKQLHTDRFYQTLKPYTLLGYGSSLNKDYQIKIIHTQNIKPRWNVAFMYDLVSRDGLYTNSEVTNHILDATTNYYSKDARYQLQAGISFNRLRQQENGGVQNDTTCWDYSREAGVPVNMYAAQNQWRDLDIHIHQSYNTVRQFQYLRPIVETVFDTIKIDTVKARHEYSNDSVPGVVKGLDFIIQKRDTVVGVDTILPPKPHTYNTGVFAWDINFSRHRRIFYDSQADSWFYNYASIDTSFYYDSTVHYKLSSEIYWTNDAYMSHRWRNPFVLLFGVRPEYNKVQFAGQSFANSSLQEFSVNPFARVELNTKRALFTAMAEEVTGSIRNGDYRINGNLRINAGRHSLFDVAVLSEAQSPDLIYYHNEGCYSWDNPNFNKVKRQQVALRYKMQLSDQDTGWLRYLETRTSAQLLSDNIWLSNAMRPTQGNETGLLLQGIMSTHLRFGWFNIRLQEMLQYSGNDNVVRVPLFASKNSLYADVFLFRRALHLQTGFDLRYHTKYYADGWNPVLGAFYRQNDTEVGNYPVVDFWVTLQIKRASIYLKASHFDAPIEQMLEPVTGLKPSYFSLPHYPMEGFGLYWGVTWKFFN